MIADRKLSLSMPLLGGLGLFACGLVGGTVYNLYLVRELESGLAEVRLSLDRLRTRPAAEPVEPARPPVDVALREELDAMRAQVTELAKGVARRDVVAAEVPAPETLAPTPPPAAKEGLATPIDERMSRILGSLESQDQALLKEAVAAVLEQREEEEREARRKRQLEGMVREMTRLLALNAEQSAQAAAVIAERMKMIEDLRAQTNDANREELRGKMQEIRQQGEEQLSHFLTADQVAKYKEWQGANDGQGRTEGGRFGGGPGRGPR